MLLDKRSKLIEDLDNVIIQLRKLLLLKKIQDEALETDHFSELYEFAENERIIIEDINSYIKILIGDLVAYKKDPLIKKRIDLIDSLQERVIKINISMRNELDRKVQNVGKKLASLNRFRHVHNHVKSPVINIRA